MNEEMLFFFEMLSKLDLNWKYSTLNATSCCRQGWLANFRQ